jgi:hypothetical protein
MHANHAASKSARPPADIPVRSSAAAPSFAQVLGAALNSRHRQRSGQQRQVSAGSQSEPRRISTRPAELDCKPFPQNRECRFEFHADARLHARPGRSRRPRHRGVHHLAEYG